MNGSDYNKMIENFKASSELRQTTINAAHSRIFKKLKISKREKIVRCSSVVGMVAMVVVLFFVFDVGGAFSTAGNSIKGNTALSSGSDTAQLSTEKTSQTSTESSTEKVTEKSTEIVTVKSTEASTEKQTTKAQEVVTTAATKGTIITTTALLPDISTVNKTSDTTYSISPFMTQYGGSDISIIGYDLPVNVKVTKEMGPIDQIELKTGNANQYTVNTTAIASLFKDGLSAFRIKGNHITLINENEGVLLFASVSSPGVTQSYTEQYFGDNKLVAFFAHSCVTGSSVNAEIINTDKEWRGVVKIENNGYVVKQPFNAKGYMAVVVDKVNKTSCVMYCLKTNPTAEETVIMYEAVKNFTFTK